MSKIFQHLAIWYSILSNVIFHPRIHITACLQLLLNPETENSGLCRNRKLANCDRLKTMTHIRMYYHPFFLRVTHSKSLRTFTVWHKYCLPSLPHYLFASCTIAICNLHAIWKIEIENWCPRYPNKFWIGFWAKTKPHLTELRTPNKTCWHTMSFFYLPSIFGLWHLIQVPWLAWCWLNWFINKSAILGTARSFLMVMVDGFTS